MTALEVQSVTAARGSRTILRDVSLSLDSGVVGLLGVNGAGKTTLLSVLSGILAPAAGSVSIGPHELWQSSARTGAVERIALVPQEFEFPNRFTVTEFLRYMAFLRKVPRHERATTVQRCLAETDLHAVAAEPLRTLSGGTLRRVAIAQGLLSDPDVLLLDEPTANLDPVQRAAVRKLIADLGAERLVMLATHITEDVETTCNDVVIIHNGRVLFTGTLAALKEHSRVPLDASLETAFVKVVQDHS